MAKQGLGDVIDPALREIIHGWEHLGRRGWIVKPDFVPPQIHGMEAQQEMLERHSIPRLWQLLADFYELQKRGVQRVQNPSWLVAPITSESEDLRSAAPVALSNGTPTTILEYRVPDRHLASFLSFGHELSKESQWGLVSWTIKVNGRQVRTYKDFTLQIGNFINPTPFSRPIILRGKDHLIVEATGTATAVDAYARMPGFVFAATAVTQDGSFRDWNVR